MRTSSAVTDDDCRHPADRLDPTAPGYGAHLPFHTILQRCGLAWRDFLAATPGLDTGLIVPHLSSDFLAEVNVGTLDIDVSLTRIGASSFTVMCAVSQDGVPAARVTVVLVSFDYETRTTVPLSATQRSLLDEMLAGAIGR